MGSRIAGMVLTAATAGSGALALPGLAATSPDPAVAMAQLAHQACITDEPTLAVATAIGLAESGGRSDAHGDTTITDGTWGDSIGYWQVRSIWAQAGTGQPRDATRLEDPAFNARSMCSISSDGTNWRPWSTWLNDAYLAHMAEARDAAHRVMTGQSLPAQPASGPTTTQPGQQPAQKPTLGNRVDEVYQDLGGGLDGVCAKVDAPDRPELTAACDTLRRAYYGDQGYVTPTAPGGGIYTPPPQPKP
jgi:hypothetical protein